MLGLVTVGTTKFEALVRALDDPLAIEYLARRGVTKLVMQIGNGQHEPTTVCGAETVSGVDCSFYRFTPDLARDIAKAGLVISHAGAGTVMECLRAPGKRELIVVVNDQLMDNHQVELAEAMAARGVLQWTLPDSLLDLLQKAPIPQKPYPPSDVHNFASMLDKEMFS